MQVFGFDLVAYPEHFDHLKVSGELPASMGAGHQEQGDHRVGGPAEPAHHARRLLPHINEHNLWNANFPGFGVLDCLVSCRVKSRSNMREHPIVL